MRQNLYQHIWADKRHGGTLYKHLRQSNKKRKKQYGSKDKRGQIRNRISIDERPEIVVQKTRLGDWKIDSVIGQNHQDALVTIVDRVAVLRTYHSVMRWVATQSLCHGKI